MQNTLDQLFAIARFCMSNPARMGKPAPSRSRPDSAGVPAAPGPRVRPSHAWSESRPVRAAIVQLQRSPGGPSAGPAAWPPSPARPAAQAARPPAQRPGRPRPGSPAKPSPGRLATVTARHCPGGRPPGTPARCPDQDSGKTVTRMTPGPPAPGHDVPLVPVIPTGKNTTNLKCDLKPSVQLYCQSSHLASTL
jgi:hypothetical protein